MSAAEVEQFAGYLAGLNTDERAIAQRRANLIAANKASPESLAEASRPPLLRRAVDLGQLIREGIPPVEYLPGEFARRIVYAAGVTGFTGHPDSGKTTFVCRLALDAMRHGQRVIYLDFENGSTGAARRFVALGADAGLLSEQMVYVPFPGALDFDELGRIWDAHEGALGVFDSTRGMLRCAGVGENDASEVATVFDPLVELALSREVPLLVIDHVAKAATSASGYARGSGDKLAAVQGQWFVEKVRPFSETEIGEVKLTKWKAREGGLLSSQRLEVGDGNGNIPFRKLDPDETPEGRIDSAIIAFLKEQAEPVSQRAVEHAVEGTGAIVRSRLKALAGDESRPVVATEDRNPRFSYSAEADKEPHVLPL